MPHEQTWRITEFQQWASLFIVVIVTTSVAFGLFILWLDLRKTQSIRQWTEEFIPDSSEVAATIRSLPELRDKHK